MSLVQVGGIAGDATMTATPAAKKKFPLKTLFSFLGPGFLVTVGFIDPGNWATNIEGGSQFGYQLLWVITLSTIMLIVIQNMPPSWVSLRESLWPSTSEPVFPRRWRPCWG